jgi:8-oxo-dGTP pyrophosphatase MutT (NUDIX family)
VIDCHANSRQLPYHVSVGILAVNDRGELLVLRRPDGIHTLITGTIKPGEPLVETVVRELAEEAGGRGELTAFVGSTVMSFTWDGRRYDKTLLWHQVTVTNLDASLRDPQDAEADALPIWMTADHAIAVFCEQGARHGDWDFSDAVRRLHGGTFSDA